MIFDINNACYAVCCTESSGEITFTPPENMLCVVLTIEGKSKIVSDELSKTHLTQSSLAVFKSPYCFVAASSCKCIYAFIAGECVKQFASNFSKPKIVCESHFSNCANILNQLLSQSENLKSYTASAISYMLLCELTVLFTSNNTASYPPLVTQAIQAIHQNFAGLYGVEELSEALGVTKSHLVRTFHAATGVTPGQYLCDTRINAAKQLLLNRRYSLDVVASLAGFSGANYLCKVFKKYTGETPLQYRDNNIIDLPLSKPVTELEDSWLV